MVQSAPFDPSLATVSVTTTAPEPLSKMPVIVVTRLTLPSTGMGACNERDCSPWTSVAGSNSPICETHPSLRGSTTGKVGRTCCACPALFSVVNSSSKPVGSSAPAPTPRAYRRASLDVHDTSMGLVAKPTLSVLSGIFNHILTWLALRFVSVDAEKADTRSGLPTEIAGQRQIPSSDGSSGSGPRERPRSTRRRRESSRWRIAWLGIPAGVPQSPGTHRRDFRQPSGRRVLRCLRTPT